MLFSIKPQTRLLIIVWKHQPPRLVSTTHENSVSNCSHLSNDLVPKNQNIHPRENSQN